jgi:NitT/TauT family transport system substrate-binding protein
MGHASTPQIRLAENFRAVFYAPFYAAHALGFYGREAVDVELISSAAPGDGVSALLDGTADITWGGPMRVMKAKDQEPASPLVCFGEVVARDPFYLIGRKNLRNFQLADLTRLKFAAVAEVPTPWLCLALDLRENGIDLSSVNRAPGRSMAQNYEALCRGELDVVQVFEPYPSLALQDRAGQILYAASERGRTVYTTFIATRAGIKRHRTAFVKMVRAMRHMQDWLAGHSVEELAEITGAFFPDIAPKILANSLRRYYRAGIWACAPEVSREGFARLAESLLSGGFITGMPVYEDCVDKSVCRLL